MTIDPTNREEMKQLFAEAIDAALMAARSSIVELSHPLEEAAAEFLKYHKVPNEEAEATFDRAATAVKLLDALLAAHSAKGEE